MMWEQAKKKGQTERDYSWDPNKKTMTQFLKYTMKNTEDLASQMQDPSDDDESKKSV